MVIVDRVTVLVRENLLIMRNSCYYLSLSTVNLGLMRLNLLIRVTFKGR